MNDYGRVEDAAGVPRLDGTSREARPHLRRLPAQRRPFSLRFLGTARVKDDVDRMRRHVVAGTPFVATNVTDGWLAWDEWRKGRGQEGEALDLEAFGAFFADAEVPVRERVRREGAALASLPSPQVVLQSGDGAAAQGYGGGERVQRALCTSEGWHRARVGLL